MCWPSCKGGAYIGVSVFIYRAVLVAIAMISSSITRLKTTYLPITVIEELLLQLIYFIPIFTSSCFIFIGLESNSFTFTFYSTIALGTTLFTRYVGELTYIYMLNWESLRQKLPSLILNLIFDLILLLTILLYARNRLRNKQYKSRDQLPYWNSSKDIYEEECLTGQNQQPLASNYKLDNNSNLPKSKGLKETNILNDLSSKEDPYSPYSPYYKSLKGLNPTDNGKKNGKVGVGQGLGSGVALHYPPSMNFDPERQKRPLPPVPKDEMDDISLPPPVPLAAPDYDDL